MRLPGLIAALCCTAVAVADGPGDQAQDVAVRYREPEAIVQELARAVPPGAVCMVLLDADQATKDRGLGARWATAFQRAFAGADKPVRLGLAAVEHAGHKILLPPTTDHDRFAAAITAHGATGRDEFRDAMRAVRELATQYATPTAKVHVVLISAVNVEGENDIAATLGALRAGRITLHVIGRGAYLSDSYWAANRTGSEARKAPKGMVLRGPEGPARELPMGLAFDYHNLDNTAPSGWGIYGFARLVAGTGGRYWIWAPPSSTSRSHCSWISCRLCTGKHQGCDRVYADSYLGLMAPFLGTRAQYARAVKGKPLWTVIYRTWKAVADAGAVQTAPPALLKGELPKREGSARASRYLRSVTGRGGWKSRAAGARKLAAAITKTLPPLQTVLAAVKRQDAPRAWATAATLEAQILACRFNLLQFGHFCEAVDVELRRGFQGEDWEEPLVPRVKPPNAYELGWSHYNYSFCHGAGWLSGVEWLGGDAAQSELAELAKVVHRNLTQLASTPYETQNRHLPVAYFRAWWRVHGTATPPPRNRGDLKDGSGATGRQGGPRRGGGAGGGTGGTGTSGG